MNIILWMKQRFGKKLNLERTNDLHEVGESVDIPRLSLRDLWWSKKPIYEALDPVVYGMNLAKQVTEKLKKSSERSGGVAFSHRDYCGLGLFFRSGKYIMSTVYDGYEPVNITDEEVLVVFDSEEAFITWLAEESDQRMSLYGQSFNNQTITKLRLLWYLEDDYSPVWNQYCAWVSCYNKEPKGKSI